MAPPPPSPKGLCSPIRPRSARELAKRRRAGGVLVYAEPSSKPGRIGGVPPAVVAALHAAGAFDVTLVKADGARMRWI